MSETQDSSHNRLGSLLKRKSKRRPKSARTPSDASSSIASERQPSFDNTNSPRSESISRTGSRNNSSIKLPNVMDDRQSSESFRDKLLGHDEHGHSRSRRLSALLHRKKKDKDNNSIYGDDGVGDDSTLSLSQSPSNANTMSIPAPRGKRFVAAEPNDAESNLVGDNADSASLLTDASDDDQLQRPSLTPHDSHRGFLTLSNPQVHAETIDPSQVHGSLIDTSSSSVPVNASPLATVSSATAQPINPGGVQSTVTTHQVASQTSSPRKSLLLKGIRTDTDAPLTPSTGPSAPTTFVTPPTPTNPEDQHGFSRSSGAQTYKSPTPVTRSSAAGHSRSGSEPKVSSRLINQLSRPPLTPALEEVKTPGGGLSAPGSGGFFSSVFSTASNAASSLTNTLTSTVTQRSRSGTNPSQERLDLGAESDISPGAGEGLHVTNAEGTRKPLAVATLGQGSLSLSHLGITDSTAAPMSGKADLAAAAHMRHDEAAAHAEDDAAAKAVSVAYSDKPASIAPSVDSRTTLHEPQTPAKSSMDDSNTIVRANSVRSRLSGKRRRTRGSSSATGATVGIPLPSQRLGGFAVANSKRNRDFHALFKSVPEDDYLIEDYSAALQREILLQGRLYISEGHVCFSSNIFGYVTNIIVSFDEVMLVEKKSTAMIFHNGLVLNTLHAKHTFASLMTRDTTYDLIVNIWKISQPRLRSSLNGQVVKGNDTGDKTEKADSQAGDDDSASEEVYDEDEEDSDDDDDDDGDESFVEAKEGSVMGSEAGDAPKAANRKVSTATSPPAANGAPAKPSGEKDAGGGDKGGSSDAPGPATHEPTECTDKEKHYDVDLMDGTVPAPLGKIYSLLFGPASAEFMRKFMQDDQKCFDVEIAKDEKGMGSEKKTRSYSYIKPLGGSIGPKQTKCIINETLETFDLEKAISVDIATQNPDVPNGGMFVVKTKYCLMWAPGNATRVLVNCTIEWSGKSWIKGAIEKGAKDGQTQYTKDLMAALKAAVSSKGSGAKSGKSGKKGGKRRKDAGDSATASSDSKGSSGQKSNAASDWGIFEPLHGILGPLEPLFSPPAIIIFLIITILYLLWQRRSANTSNLAPHRLGTSARMAAYEQMWQAEEKELWDWLEDRIGLAGVSPAHGYGSSPASILDAETDPAAAIDPKKQKQALKQREKEQKERQKLIENAKRRVGSDSLNARNRQELDEAIKVTRERLEELEHAVNEHKAEARANEEVKV